MIFYPQNSPIVKWKTFCSRLKENLFTLAHLISQTAESFLFYI